jgi:hypothetical protein
VRAKKNITGGDTVYLHLALMEGAVVRATTSDGDAGWPKTLTDSFADYTWDIPSGEIAAVTAYTDLRLRISAVKP